MPVDISMQYRGHNSYRLQANERYLSAPFAVENMSFITHSFWVMASSTLTSDIRARTRLYDSDGMLLTVLSHQFAIDTLWEFVELSMAVPEGAHSAQLEFMAGSSGFWFVEPKSETGQTATPYNINYAGQLSKISPTGAYFGLLHANQILLTGTQADPGEMLDTRITTLNNNVLSMSATISGHGSRLTSIEAGQIVLRDEVDNNAWNITSLSSSQITLSNTVSQKTTKITSAGIYTGDISANQITAGTLKSANGHSSINMANGTFNFGNGALTWSGSELSVIGKLTTSAGGVKPARIEVERGVLSVYSSSGTQLGRLTNAGQYTAGSGDGLSIMGGSSSQYLDIGFWAADLGGMNYIRLNNVGSGKPYIELTGEVQMSSNLKVSTIKHKTTNNNIFYTDATGTWISSPNGQSHLFISNNIIQLIRNGTVLQQW